MACSLNYTATPQLLAQAVCVIKCLVMAKINNILSVGEKKKLSRLDVFILSSSLVKSNTYSFHKRLKITLQPRSSSRDLNQQVQVPQRTLKGENTFCCSNS